MKTLFALILALFAGCAYAPRTAARIDRQGRPAVVQSGAAKTPAVASVETSRVTVPLPAGSKIFTIPAPLAPPASGKSDMTAGVTFTTSAPTVLTVETRRETVSGAQTPEPPPPPSPVDIARGKGVAWFYGAAVLCALAAVVGFVRGYPLAGICFAGGAVCLPLAANVISSGWFIIAAGVCVVAGGVLFVAWKILAARHGLENQAGTMAKNAAPSSPVASPL